MGDAKAFRVSSLSSAAEQRRLFAMHFVLRSSVDSSRWKRKTGTDRRKRWKKREKSNQGDAPMIITVGDYECAQNLSHEVCGVIIKLWNKDARAVSVHVSTSSLVSCLVSCMLYASFQLLFVMML